MDAHASPPTVAVASVERMYFMSLDRFKKAQEDPVSGFATAIAELRSGRKTSHWIWYVLPQLASLGRSSTAQFYGINDAGEARDYVRDPLLRARLMEALEVIADHLGKGVPVQVLMGSGGDSAKLASCATLF
jgi:uncharacterized protein (DUF1810 family)